MQVVTWCRQIKKRRGNYPSSKWCFCLVLRRQDDKGPVVVLEGGWKLRCESLGNLRYFLHGRVERVGDIVQVVHGADKSRNGEGTTLPLNGVFALFLEDKMTKDPWLFWRGCGSWDVNLWEVVRYFLHGLVERVGDIVQVVTWRRQTKKRSRNYPSSKWCFCLVCERQADRGYVWLFCVWVGSHILPEIYRSLPLLINVCQKFGTNVRVNPLLWNVRVRRGRRNRNA